MEQQDLGIFDLQLDPMALSALTETAKWNKFMAIVWFVLSGLFALFSIYMGTLIASLGTDVSGPLAGLSGGFVALFYLFLTAIQFIPNIFRYRFSVKMINAIRNGDQGLLNESLNSLKIYSKYWGIVTIIGVSLFAIFFLFFIAGLLLQMR